MSAKKWASVKERDRYRKRVKNGWTPDRAMEMRSLRVTSSGKVIDGDKLDVPFAKDAEAQRLAQWPRTQQEIAAVYGVDHSTIDRIETEALRKIRQRLARAERQAEAHLASHRRVA